MTASKFRGIVAGIDEAGRGSWAGPVVAAAVILPRGFDPSALRDSKLLTPHARERLFERITSACAFAVGVVGNATIDRIGIKQATHRAMLSALRKLPIRPAKLMIDGNDGFRFALPTESIIRGDQLIPAISAASIVAKVWRDRLMLRLHARYGAYGFDRHKGYGTALHLTSLQCNGPCSIHRMSFRPLTDGIQVRE